MDFLTILQPLAEVILMVSASFLVLFLSIYLFAKNDRKGFKILVLLTVIMLYSLYCEKLDKIFLAPSYVSTFSQLKNETKWPLRLSLIETEGGNYIEAVIFPGKIPALIRLSSFRSGMPAYVFNENGMLVDSSIDQHDDARYQDKWERAKKRKLITETDFLKIIKTSNSGLNLTNGYSSQ